MNGTYESKKIFFREFSNVHIIEMKNDWCFPALIQGRNQVYGIRDHSLGIGIMDPGSRVTSDGIRISQFFLVLEGIKDRSLFRYFILYEKQEYSVLQGKRPLFRTIEKAFNLYTSILLRFRHAISCLKLFSLVFHVA